jgi:hypothetical protein
VLTVADHFAPVHTRRHPLYLQYLLTHVSSDSQVWLTDGLTDSGEIALYSALMISVGNLGGISGPQIYGAVGSSRTKADGSPDYRIAHAVMACIGAGAFCTAAILTYTTTCTVTTATYGDGREDKNTPGHANTRASESTPLLQTDESLSSV